MGGGGKSVSDGHYFAWLPGNSAFPVSRWTPNPGMQVTFKYIADNTTAPGAAGLMDRPTVKYREYDSNRDISLGVLEPPTDTGALQRCTWIP